MWQPHWVTHYPIANMYFYFCVRAALSLLLLRFPPLHLIFPITPIHTLLPPTDAHYYFWWQVLQLILPLILAPPLPLHTLYFSMYVRISFDSVTTSLWVCFNCHKMHRRRLRRTERKLAHTLIRTLNRSSSSLHVQWIKSSIICLSDNPTEFRVQFSGTQVAI